MRASSQSRFVPILFALCFSTSWIVPGEALASGKVGLHVLRMVPQNKDARAYSKAAWGVGLDLIRPLPGTSQVLAGTFAAEVANFLSKSKTLMDPDTGIRTEQSTNQFYIRAGLGVELGSHSKGFLRPHAGTGFDVVYYDISTTLTIPDDSDPERSITQDLGGKSRTRTGYNITLGVDLNFKNSVSLDGGVRYLKSFGIPQQLGMGAVTIYPDYFQVYFGVGLSAAD